MTLNKICYAFRDTVYLEIISKFCNGTGLPKQKITKWLDFQHTYNLHIPFAKYFPRKQDYVRFEKTHGKINLAAV